MTTAHTISVQGVEGFRSLRSWVAVLAVIVLFTNLTYFIPTLVSFVIPSLWIVGFVGGLLFIMARERVRLHPVIWWSFGYLLLTVLWYSPLSPADNSSAEIQRRILSVTVLGTMVLVFAERRTLRTTRYAVAAAIVFSSLINLFEVFQIGVFSTVYGRSAGLYGNSNQSGAALVLGLIIAQDVVSPRWRGWLWLCTGAGVLTTFSRAAMVGFLGVLILTSLREGRRIRGTATFVIVCFAAIGFVMSPMWSSLQSTMEANNIGGHDAFGRLEAMLGGEEDESITLREEVASLAWHSFLDHPVLGTGTGSAVSSPFDTLGPHNQYLALAVDHGILGLLAYPTLILMTVVGGGRNARLITIPFAFFALLWGFFSHNILEEPYFLVSFAIVAAVVGVCRAAEREPIEVSAELPVHEQDMLSIRA